jgi:hypothetical protein
VNGADAGLSEIRDENLGMLGSRATAQQKNQ